jgi:hypothetical protein
METDHREQRLRDHFGFMMLWTAVAIGVFGFVLGDLLGAAFTASGFVYGFTLSESTIAAVRISGHATVGLIVLIGIVKAYLDPQSDAFRDD